LLCHQPSAREWVDSRFNEHFLQRVWRRDHASTKILLIRHLCRKATAVSLVVDSPQTFMPGAFDARGAPLLISLTYGDTGRLSTFWLPWNPARTGARLVVAPQGGGQVPPFQLPHPDTCIHLVLLVLHDAFRARQVLPGKELLRIVASPENVAFERLGSKVRS
jgi:hypothetical protein